MVGDVARVIAVTIAKNVWERLVTSGFFVLGSLGVWLHYLRAIWLGGLTDAFAKVVFAFADRSAAV